MEKNVGRGASSDDFGKADRDDADVMWRCRSFQVRRQESSVARGGVYRRCRHSAFYASLEFCNVNANF